jgi:hypothetical protein
MKNYNKINLYKDNIIKFIQCQTTNIINIDKITNIDYLIGILFLTEMNRYCKVNKISIHGYYIAYSLINLFIKIKKKLIKKEIITNKDINHFWTSVANNIDYLNSRVNDTNLCKNKINHNFCKYIIEIEKFLTELVEFSEKHSEDNINCTLSNNSSNKIKSNSSSPNSVASCEFYQSDNKYIKLNSIYCNKKCYICWVDNVLKKFFYILLITAKFIGSGDIKDPNLLKMSEYYSNIFFTYLKIEDLNIKLDEHIRFEFFDKYIDYKNKLNYSIIELKINSDTLEEIINFLDEFILLNLSSNNK